MTKRFDMFRHSITSMVDGAKDPEAPFREEQLALHLLDQSTHLYGQAQLLKLHASQMTGMAAALAQSNGDQLEEYAIHCATEANRLVKTMDPAALRRLRDDDLEQRELAAVAAAFPFVPKGEV